MRRTLVLGLLLALALLTACTNKKSTNPLAKVGSKQPDKVLFDRAMDAMKHNRFDVARMTLQTLINTYPDSEYIARAKLAVADSWYAEGGSTALQQAEIEYKDFKTFFPNMPEAAEAQLKVANIHYQQMEKPDRDFTHAMRAEEEYRALINEYPDSKLVPQAKQRLREVQEVLAQREYNIGRFYYLRQVYPAAIARLKTLADRYPLYSGADQALYLLGESYEAEIDMVRRNPRASEVVKSKMIEQLTKDAAAAYDRIITRYPAMDRAVDAEQRLEALKQPVPKPTRAMLEQNKKEAASRQETSMVTSMLNGFEKHPDVAHAAHAGDPSMTDPEPMTATGVVREMVVAAGADADGKIAAGIVNAKGGTNQQAPRSDNPTPAGDTTPTSTSDTSSTTAQNVPSTSAGTSELKATAADSNELKPNVDQDPNPLPPPTQSNQLESSSSSSTAGTSSSKNSGDELVDISSSRKKKKKGIHKLNPF